MINALVYIFAVILLAGCNGSNPLGSFQNVDNNFSPKIDARSPLASDVQSWSWTQTSPTHGTISSDYTPILSLSGADKENKGTVTIYSDALCQNQLGTPQIITFGGTYHDDLTLATDGSDDGDIEFHVKISDTSKNDSFCTKIFRGYTLQVAPSATDDSFTDTKGAIGNTPLTVSINNGLLANDNDLDGGSLSVVAGTITTTLNGHVELAENGSFTYTPPLGVKDKTDTFTYQVENSKTTKTATASIEISGIVWYVKNNVDNSGDGSFTKPFQSLAEAQAASSAGDSIFLYEGDGTSANQNSGIVLKDNQELIGQGVSLVKLDRTIVSASQKPTIGHSSGSAITLANANTIRGLKINGTTNHGIYTSSAITGLSIDQIEITSTNTVSESGIQIDSFSGSLQILQSTFSTTDGNIGDAINITTLNGDDIDATIALNVFDGSPAGGGMSEAISMNLGTGSGTGTQNVRVLENTMTETKTGVHILSYGDITPDIVASRNTISTTDDEGIMIRGYENTAARMDVISNNLTTTGGMGIRTQSAGTSNGRSQITGNTVTNPNEKSIWVASAGTSTYVAEIEGNSVTSNYASSAAIIVINQGTGTNTHYDIRNNSVFGSPKDCLEASYTANAGGSTCSRVTGNDFSAATPTVSDFRTNKQAGSTQLVEDTIGGSPTFDTYIQNANTGLTVTYHNSTAPTLTSAGNCTLIENHRPTISQISDQNVAASGTLSNISFTVSDVEDASSALSVSAVSTHQGFVSNENISISTQGGGAYALTIKTSSHDGTAVILVTVTDLSGLSATEPFKVSMSP